MPVNWTIAGETGKAFNATARSLSTAAIDSAKLDFKSLEPDTLTFTITPESLTSATIPELRQEMILYRDGVQFFVGHVTDVRTMINSGMQQCQITVSGPWWWLEKIPFTSTMTDGAGATAERISYVFGTASAGQNLAVSIRAAIDRSAALGAPIATIAQGSSVDAMFAVPRITLNQSTCGQVISELVRICPDTMVWFDYSTKPVKMNVVRRGPVGARSLDSITSPITSIDINPVIDLEVSQVVLPFVDRDTQGRTKFQVQTAGTNQMAKRQIITISGPELDTFLPNDLFDSQVLTVVPNLTNFVHDSDPLCVSAAANAAISRLPISIAASNLTYWTSVAPRISAKYSFGGAVFKNSGGGTLTGYNILTSLPPANWSTINWRQGTLTATMWGRHRYTVQGKGTYPTPAYWANAGFAEVAYGYETSANNSDIYKWFAKTIYISCNATNQVSSSLTIYREADYSFIAPPANLSANLLAAQNWLPYEGSITLEEEDVGATRYRGNKINLINSIPAYSAMGALVSGESLEIESGRTTISLGAPARNDYRTLVDKIRKTSQDNIVYV
jgi:hypothetical protein